MPVRLRHSDDRFWAVGAPWYTHPLVQPPPFFFFEGCAVSAAEELPTRWVPPRRCPERLPPGCVRRVDCWPGRTRPRPLLVRDRGSPICSRFHTRGHRLDRGRPGRGGDIADDRMPPAAVTGSEDEPDECQESTQQNDTESKRQKPTGPPRGRPDGRRARHIEGSLGKPSRRRSAFADDQGSTE